MLVANLHSPYVPTRFCKMTLDQQPQRRLAFLKRAAIELRKIAEQAPEVAAEVRRISDELDAEAAEMEKQG